MVWERSATRINRCEFQYVRKSTYRLLASTSVASQARYGTPSIATVCLSAYEVYVEMREAHLLAVGQ